MRARQAVILIGGKGTRLGALTKDYPKPLLPVNGHPFLDRVLTWLVSQGVRHLVLLAGHAAHVVKDAYADGHFLGAKLDICIETSPRGTGGALHEAAPLLEDEFLLLNGDSILDFNLNSFLFKKMPPHQIAHLALRQVPDVSRFGAVTKEDGEHGDLTSFGEKSGKGTGLINAGIYRLKRGILSYIPETGACSLESETIPQLLEKRVIGGTIADGYFIDIGLPETLEEAGADLDTNLTHPAIFFDRDGVLNEDDGYFYDPAKLKWREGALEAIRYASEQGYICLVVTNQGGVGKGLYTLEDVDHLHKVMLDQIQAAGGTIAHFYSCPHHPDAVIETYRAPSPRRKPNPGMILDGLKDFPIDKERSVLLGDKESDMQAAKAAGIKGFMVTDAPLLEDLKKAILG